MIGSPLQAAPPPPDAIRERADEILARPEFTREKPLLQRVLEWIGEQLSRFSFGIGDGPGFLGNLIGLIVLAGAVVLIVVLVRTFRSRPRREVEPALSIEEEARRSAAEWRSDAERFEAEGRWREAMRARYRELVRMLVDDGVLVDVPGRTTGEYRVDITTARPEAAAPIAELTDLFEATWYGGHPTGPEQNRRFRELAGDVRQRMRQLVGAS